MFLWCAVSLENFKLRYFIKITLFYLSCFIKLPKTHRLHKSDPVKTKQNKKTHKILHADVALWGHDWFSCDQQKSGKNSGTFPLCLACLLANHFSSIDSIWKNSGHDNSFFFFCYFCKTNNQRRSIYFLLFL